MVGQSVKSAEILNDPFQYAVPVLPNIVAKHIQVPSPKKKVNKAVTTDIGFRPTSLVNRALGVTSVAV